MPQSGKYSNDAAGGARTRHMATGKTVENNLEHDQQCQIASAARTLQGGYTICEAEVKKSHDTNPTRSAEKNRTEWQPTVENTLTDPVSIEV